MLKFIIPLLAAVVAILQDAYIIFDIDGCTKDNQLVALLILLTALACSRQFVLKRFWWMLALIQGSLVLTNAFIVDYLPDTWSATESLRFSGYPVLQGAALGVVTVLSVIGYRRRQINVVEMLKAWLGIVLIIVSAQLWLYGNRNIESEPWRAWNNTAHTDRIVMVTSKGQYVGDGWVKSNTNYALTMDKLKAFWATSDDQFYFTGPRIGHPYPYLYQLVRLDTGLVVLSSQARDMSWGPDMVWIWEYVLSFVLVFVETFLIAHTFVRLWCERRDLRISLRKL